jgi:hypothetical protein
LGSLPVNGEDGHTQQKALLHTFELLTANHALHAGQDPVLKTTGQAP